MRLIPFFILAVCLSSAKVSAQEQPAKHQFRAGASAMDITPPQFPVIVNGYFNERQGQRAHDRLKSRALVLDDGQTRLAIVVVDSLMIQRELLDIAKQMAHEATGIPIKRMLISATHTHSAPAAMGCLGSRADANYQRFLPGQIARSIHQAAANLAPAKVGWAIVQDYQHNHCRRWIFRPDRTATDPFGNRNVRAHMHPGHLSQNHIGPSGPADPDLSLLSVQSVDGRPLAVLANYALHYYGSPLISGDFCGRFGAQLAELIGVKPSLPPFVGIMSQGTSGDSMWMDFSRPAAKGDLKKYTLEVARVAQKAYHSIEYHEWVSLAMAETTLKLRRRIPDQERLAWSRELLTELGDRQPQTKPEIYAREQLYLHDQPEVELKLQAIRIGALGITAIPNEVYGITGLKLKAQSPLQSTFHIELANGAQGYIPPPEQHTLGGYTTWPARTAGLEVEAEPKVVAALLDLLEKVADKPRRQVCRSPDAYAKIVLSSQPVAYWRLNEMSGSCALDVTGKQNGIYEQRIAFYLPGPWSAQRRVVGSGRHPIATSRAAHFAGGRMKAAVLDLGQTYSVEFWFWNGLPQDARPVTGYLFSRGAADAKDAGGDHLGIGGTHRNGVDAGKLIFFNGNKKNEVLAGHTQIPAKSWNHVVLIRDGNRVAVHLNGKRVPEIAGAVEISRPNSGELVFLGGRNDGFAPFAGKLAEVAIYDRVVSPEEIATHFQGVVHSNSVSGKLSN